MKNALDVLLELQRRGIKVRAESGHLRVNAPKGVLTEELRSAIQARKAEVLELIGLQSLETSVHRRHIPLAPRGSTIPLSFSQQRLWFLEQLEGATGAYNRMVALRIRGELPKTLLQESIAAVVARHEALRTTFTMEGNTPIQVIQDTFPIRVDDDDLRLVPAKAVEKEIHARSRQEALFAFDLAKGPLFRVRLLRLRSDESLLLVTMHHIIADGWSMGIFIREVVRWLRAPQKEAVADLPTLPVQYSDYAVWQRERFVGEALHDHLSFWRERLKGAPEFLQLPTDMPRPSRQTFAGSAEPVQVDRELTNQLQELAIESQSSLFMILLTGYGLLLYKYSRQEEFLIGAPVANRLQPEIEPLIGCFANTLVLRLDLQGNPTFRELLARVTQDTLHCLQHQELPFEMVIEELQPVRSLSHTPLFQVMFAFQNTPRELINIPGLGVEQCLHESWASKFDLTLYVEESARGVSGALEYNSDLFGAPTISRMVGHFETILREVASNPGLRIDEIQLVSRQEKERLLFECNSTRVADVSPPAAHQRFEEQARTNANATALIWQNRQLSYGELNGRANQLARYLRAKGFGPEQIAGISMARKPEMIVAMLAILKAGGAYVWLDPTYPSDRLAFVVEDTGLRFVLGLEEQPQSPSVPNAEMILLDRDWFDIGREEASDLDVAVDGHNLAYVMYTSGSTGKPKGVAIEHHNTTNLIQLCLNDFEAADLRGVLASTTLGFDLSVFEIFVTLSSGGALILVDNLLAFDQQIHKDKVTLISTVPSLMKELLRETRLPLSVSVVNLIGERVERSLVEQIYAKSDVKIVNNLYGPTETTTYSTFAPLFKRDTGRPVIGKPVANTQIYILDQNLQVVPTGLPGEIWIGGAGVARGYLNRPELTEERFLADPFCRDVNNRMYRTGDLGRHLWDGTIELLGRVDGQIKIHGYRIEPSEIEAELNRHPQVKESVVLARSFGADDTRLVAWFVPNERPGPGHQELRNHLKKKLPPFMLPAAFVSIEAFPLTLNGKLDARALPEADRVRPEPRSEAIAPRRPIEMALAKIWGAVLEMEEPGSHDNFFDLGGASFSALRVVSMAKGEGLDITPELIFTHQTIATLADAIERHAQNPS
jgi:amino acid adenylation domain-containing protein